MENKITIKSQLRKLSFLIIYMILFIFLFYFTYSIKYMSIVSLLLLGLFTFPTIYIHYNYYKNIRGEILIFENEKIIIKSSRNNSVIVINISDIINISVFMSGARISNIVNRNFAFENYYYYEIKSKNNEIIIINSLYNENLDLMFKKTYPFLKIEIIEVYYPLIKN
ncbi:hypothetical protein AB4865_06185 [Capnocytophaga sp. ARDL2]|uniref:hypothetical protein n=1 Tax=Capnocytophaga sp. ARDL2 TaxID=3238809 RepID=UPI003555E19B